MADLPDLDELGERILGKWVAESEVMQKAIKTQLLTELQEIDGFLFEGDITKLRNYVTKRVRELRGT